MALTTNRLMRRVATGNVIAVGRYNCRLFCHYYRCLSRPTFWFILTNCWLFSYWLSILTRFVTLPYMFLLFLRRF